MYELIVKFNGRQFRGNFDTRENIDYFLRMFDQPVEYSIYRDNKLIKLGGLKTR